MLIDFLCLVGALAVSAVLLRAWVRHSYWWLAAMAIGALGLPISVATGLWFRQLGREALINYGVDPADLLRAILIATLLAIVLQMAGMVGCCAHFIRRPTR